MTQMRDAAADSDTRRGGRRRRGGLAIVAACAVGAATLLGGAPAHAAPVVACGSVVTSDLTLTADLTCTGGDGLILGSDVTLDLGGHRLSGDGSGIGVQTSGDSTGGNTIRNGTIENWATGVQMQAENPDGVPPYMVSRVKLLNAPVNHLFGNTDLMLVDVRAVDSPITGQLGGDLAISGSRLTRSPVDVFFASADIEDSTLIQSHVSTTAQGEVRIDSSRLDGKGKSALGYVSETSITITDSVVKNYAQPISGFWGGVTLTGNTFTGMPGGVLGNISSNIGSAGVSYISGNSFTRSGVVLRGNVPMVVENNTFTRNEAGVVFTRGEPLPGDPPPTAEGSRATGNVFARNAGTGIESQLPGLEVGDNLAHHNGGYGIFAPAAVDLGGNVAYRNGLGQCVGVACTAR